MSRVHRDRNKRYATPKDPRRRNGKVVTQKVPPEALQAARELAANDMSRLRLAASESGVEIIIENSSQKGKKR